MIILVTGGSRSGKSAHALRLAESQPGPWRFIATCPAIDEEMAKKIEAHKLERDARTWTTIEEEIDLAGAIAQAGAAGVILVDCLTLWINNLMYRASMAGREVTEQEVAGLTDTVVRAARSAHGTVIFVTNEVGLGIVPDNPLARQFRDHAGLLNQKVAQVADEVYFTASGIPIKIK